MGWIWYVDEFNVAFLSSLIRFCPMICLFSPIINDNVDRSVYKQFSQQVIDFSF